jgi:hypothetical protein
MISLRQIVFIPPTLSNFHTVHAKLPNDDFTAPNILLILPPLSHFHTVCMPILFWFFLLFQSFLFVGIYQLAVPNLRKFMARHSTLIQFQQK